MNTLINSLKERLAGELPGDEAHQLMMAKPIGPRFRINHEGAPKKGAVMIMLYPEEGKVLFPLTRRPEYPGVHSGQVSLPGGKVEPQDASLIETAIRETHEEIGVRIQDHEIIGSLSDLHITASNFIVKPVVSVLERKPIFTRDEHEVVKIFNADIEELIKDEIRKEKELVVGPEIRLQAPYFDVQGNVVWGATAMMLSEFVTILKEIQ